ncbi:hypothetical protein BGZ81_011858, partial [Podila clonocystis]
MLKQNRLNTKAKVMLRATRDDSGRFVPIMFPKPVPIANHSVAFQTVMDPNWTAVLLNSTLFMPDPSGTDALKTLFNQLATEHYFFCPLQYFARQMNKSSQKADVFRFHHGRGAPVVDMPGTYCAHNSGRACHTTDIQVNFGPGSVVPLVTQTGDDAG